MAKVIALTNQKGGVGKTTCCVNLAGYVAASGHRVLVVDMDPQGNATSGLGISKDTGNNSTLGVLTGRVSIKDEGVIQHTAVPNLDILPANVQLSSIEAETASGTAGLTTLSDSLDSVRKRYKYIFLDCPPSMGALTTNAIIACDSVIVPVQCEFFALEGLTQLLNNLKIISRFACGKAKTAPDGIFLTMYDRRSKLSRQVEQEVKSHFGSKTYRVMIPRNVKLAEAPSYGQPIMLYDNRCVGAKAYKQLAEEFLLRNK